MKQKILETASELFASMGVRSITMDEICDKVGISKKTLYNYYPNKDTLVEDSITLHLDNFVKDVLQMFDKSKNPIREIYDIKLYANDKMNTPSAVAQFQLKKQYPKLFKKVHRKQFEVLKGFHISNLERGIAQGYYRENLTIDFVVRLFSVITEKLHEDAVLLLENYNQNYISFHYLEYHIRAIATPKGLAMLEEIIKEYHNIINKQIG